MVRPWTGLASIFAIILTAPAAAAEWSCNLAQPIAGGVLLLTVEGDGATAGFASGALELSTEGIAPPLGLRDGTFPWMLDPNEGALTFAVLRLDFRARLPIDPSASWSAADDGIVPTRLSFLVPLLDNPSGGPIRLSGATVTTGNGIYSSAGEWSLQQGPNAIVLTNAPDAMTQVYSRELLQLIAADVTEPIVLFLTPAITAPADSIAAFYAGGIVEAPEAIRQLVAATQTARAQGNCLATEP